MQQVVTGGERGVVTQKHVLLCNERVLRAQEVFDRFHEIAVAALQNQLQHGSLLIRKHALKDFQVSKTTLRCFHRKEWSKMRLLHRFCVQWRRLRDVVASVDDVISRFV